MIQTGFRISIIFIAALSSNAFADELVLPAKILEASGYHRVSSFRAPLLAQPIALPTHALEWPVEFEDASHTMGNNMVQFQQYRLGEPYFHGGCDLRAQAGSEVKTPVRGRIDAGHYSYDTNPDGSMQKFIRPWPQSGEALYFEVSVTTDDGTVYEFHHIARSSLPADIKALLDRGGGIVEAGSVIGRVAEWPAPGIDGRLYHHIHFNIIRPDGVRINPESVAEPLLDERAPDLHGVYAIDAQGRVEVLTTAQANPTRRPVEIVVATTDRREANVYTQTPPVAQIVFADGQTTGWDFRRTLTGPTGVFAPIWDVYKSQLTLPSGQTLRTAGDYQTNFFLFRLPVPPSAHGPINIKVGDAAGNFSEFASQLN